MPVRVSCPHCRTPCQVAEQHLGVPVKCGRCGKTFTTRGEATAPAPPARLDIGVAASPRRGTQSKQDRYLVQHLVRCNLDARHELGIMVFAEDSGVMPAAAALTPLLGDVLNGTNKGADGVVELLAGACKNATPPVTIVVIWNGQVSSGGVGDCPIYHHRGGRLMRLKSGPMKLAAGDWLVLGNDPIDEPALQAEITASISSALDLAQRLAERCGRDNGTRIVVRGY